MKGITLFIFGGVAEMGDEPPHAQAELVIAAVGPLSSLAMAALFYIIYQATGVLNLSIAVSGLLQYLAMINFFLAMFNLIPAFPLDGGRILRALLWKWKGSLRAATRTAAAIGGGFGIFLIVLGVLQVLGGGFVGGMWLFLIGLFIRSAANMSYRQLQIRRALEGEPLKRFMTTNPVTATPSMTLKDLVENYVYQYHHKLYPVVEGDQLQGCITTRQIKSIDRDSWAFTTVGEVAEPCSDHNTIDPDSDAVQALAAMRQNNASRLLVSKDQHLVGIIALKDMLDFLSMKIELEEK
jgi:CBS domain-containing protein